MKRIISLVLTMVMLLGVVFSASFTVSAAATEASDSCIELLKQYEGFVLYPYEDYGQWTVGYGTKCPDDKLTEYRENGIPEEDAEELLREYVAQYEDDLQYFATHYGLSLTQNEFDALLLFTYNCGSGWVFSTNTNFHQTMAKQEPTADEVIYAFGTWSNAGNTPLVGLINRRMAEAYLYLNNVYSKNPPANYNYVIYDANGGYIVDRVHVFNVNSKNLEPLTPTMSGSTFDGWYTEKTGGTEVTALAASLNGKTLYARWDSAGTDAEDEETLVPGGDGGEEYVDVELPITVKVLSDGVNLRKGPGTNYASMGFANVGTKLTLTKVAQDNQGRLWGSSKSGWICLQYTNYESVLGGTANPDDTQSDEIEDGETRTGKVTAQGWLNVRSGAGTNYQIVHTYKTGAKIEILETKVVGSAVWGKTDKGWVSMAYVELDEAVEEEKPATKPEDDKEETPVVSKPGTIKSTGDVSIYDKAGKVTANKYKNGDRVAITETAPMGEATFGKTDKGWVNMKYVVLDVSEKFNPAADGVIKVSGKVNIRKEPNGTADIVDKYSNGDRVEITETLKILDTTWGKTDKGWVDMSYVELDEVEVLKNALPCLVKGETELKIYKYADASSEVVGSYKKDDTFKVLVLKVDGATTWGKTDKGWVNMASVEQDTSIAPVDGTIKNIGNLKIYKDADAASEVVGSYKNGDKVTITNEKKVGSTTWVKTDKGWIDKAHFIADKTQSGSTGTGTGTGNGGTTTTIVGTGTIKVNGYLNIRTGAGTNYGICGAYNNGAAVTILEKKTVSSATWGRTDKGWISMTYVVMDAQGSTGSTGSTGTTTTPTTPDATNKSGVVNVSSILNIRSGAGTGYSVTGYYNKGTRVTILETKVVGSTTWGRTDKGWVSMDYIVMGANSDSTSTGTTRTITASCLKIRKAAGTSNTVVGYLYKGAKVAILETKTVGNEVWGRIDKGWIALAYTA